MKHISLLVVTVLLTSCATQYTEFPDISNAKAEYAIVAGHFTGGTYLPEDPKCQSGEYICMDPPPVALRFEVSELVFGPRVSNRVVTFTTSHFGKSGIDFGVDHPYLLFLITNGDEFVTPRYHMKRLAWDSRDQLAAPLDAPTDSIWWLPCSVSQPASDIRFSGPREVVRIEVDHLSDDELREMRDFVRVQGATATIKRGVYVDDVGRRLNGLSKAQIDAGCDL
ncbi:MAG: hypothetical protein QNJ14_15415 [Woeseiaceae bacterium]|nr:hypothetical protein [Woeseiaceae bacterium]